MRIMLVLDHPYTLASAENIPHQRSLTAALAAATIRGGERAGHQVDVVDLAADGFNPVMTRDDLLAWRQRTAVDPLTLEYQQRLLEADHLVFAFPIWWEAMPAMTKGFLDKVVAKGIHFEELTEAKGNPFRNLMTRLHGVTALTVMTTPHAAYRWWFGDPVTKILFKGTFGKIGVKNLNWRNYASVTAKTPQQRQQMIDETETHFSTLTGPRS
ncbi:NAD(P)H-dependent oxidoreductase [Compostimonas suwonensis]|uniref:Putative NADPH-quinone reductase n=1 Tax=Compostimonas suwonensis TaxID=1048394 RepID=A0A2M9BZM0_9MICO|nr:NAD(P)H-dependent oxidoreductase [Compostimonas suwonensis]PJJ63524.1 putative NADPH-quinone reductase [Compostimonas suwonensis]